MTVGKLTKEQNTKLIKYRDILTFRNYSNKTIKAYVGHLRRLFEFSEHINKEIVYKYLIKVRNDYDYSITYYNQIYSAIKLYDNTLIDLLPFRPRKRKTLPNVLSKREVFNIIDKVTNRKHKVMLKLIYSSGLRVGELVRLKLVDIDSDRMLIKVIQGKGKKDRYTILSKKLLKDLREYYVEYRPRMWLFQGAKPYRHISERTVQQVFSNALSKTDIKKKFHFIH